MRPNSVDVMKQLLATDYIDTVLKDLSYDHLSHTVRLIYGEIQDNRGDCTVIFKDCFSATFNTWLEGMTGRVPNKPGDLGYFLHDIEVKDVEINGVTLYKCSMVIPMMDCQITCVDIEIKSPSCK